MLSVPWYLGWALRPYIQINTGNTATSPAAATTTTPNTANSPTEKDSAIAAAKAQVARHSSPSAAKRSPLPPATATPTTTTTTSSSAAAQQNSGKPYPVDTQPLVPKTTVGKTSAAPPPSQQQQQPLQKQQERPLQKQQQQQQQQQPLQQQQQQPLQKQQQQPVSAPLVAKQAQPVQASSKAPEGPNKQVSSASISLKMSAEWAQQQLEQFKFSFDEADKDKSGSLSVDEVIDILNNNGFKGSKDEAKQLFAHLDMNKDNKLTRDEFSAFMNKLPKITIKEFVLRKAFRQLDKDNSGTLTKAEIEEASKNKAGLDISADKLSELLVALEKDPKDDVIDYEEFLRVFGMQETATVMYQVFHRLDKDNSGFLNKDEIMNAISGEPELKLRATRISDLLLAWHKDQDKKIHYDEFVKVWIKYKN